MPKKKALLEQPADPQPRREDSKAIVDAIVIAARQLLPRGLEGLSFSEVAKRAGVGQASVHRYFPSRGALVAEVLRQQQLDEIGTVRAEVAAAKTMREAVARCVRATVDFDMIEARRRRMLNHQVPGSWSSEALLKSLENIKDILEAALLRLRPDLSQSEVQRRVFYGLAYTRGVTALRWLDPPWLRNRPIWWKR